MSNFYSVTWEDGNFERTASVLMFNSKAARAAFPSQCEQRVKNIDSAEKNALLKEGRMIRLMLWDASEPTKFSSVL